MTDRATADRIDALWRRRRRTAALRELVEQREAAQAAGQRPQDRSRIVELEAAVEALEAERAQANVERHPATEWREIEAAIRGATDAVEDATARIRRRGAAPAAQRGRLLTALDHLMAAAETAGEAVAPAEEPA